MKNQYTIFMLAISILCSCSSDKKEEIAKQYFEQKVNEESNGAIKVVDFRKKNGIDKEVMGQKFYEMEFYARIELNQTGWKTGNAIEGYWNDFTLLNQEPKFWDNYMQGGNAVGFVRGQNFVLDGKFNFENTENGWRIAERFNLTRASEDGINDAYLKDKKSNGMPDPSVDLNKFIGNWVSLTGDKEINFYQNGSDISYTTNAINMTPNTRTYLKKDGNTIWAKMEFSNGGGSGSGIDYYPDKDHIFYNGIEFERK